SCDAVEMEQLRAVLERGLVPLDERGDSLAPGDQEAGFPVDAVVEHRDAAGIVQAGDHETAARVRPRAAGLPVVGALLRIDLAEERLVRRDDDAAVLDGRGDRPLRRSARSLDDLPGPPALLLARTLARGSGEAAMNTDLAAVSARARADETGVVVNDADERLALLEQRPQSLLPPDPP